MATSSPYPSPAEILQQARARAAQELSAARAPVDQAAAAADKANAAHGSAIAGFSSALADILGGIQPIVKGAYEDASGRTATFAKGFSDGLRMKTQGSADQTNQYLHDVVGAPAGQMVGPDTATAAGDVAYGLGGYIPASSLAREGAAYEAAAAQLPAYARLRGQQDFTSNVFAGRDQQKQFADQIATLFAGKPKLVNDLYEQLQQDMTQKRAGDVNRAIAITQLTGEVTPEAAALLGIPKGTKTATAKVADAKAAAPDPSLSRAKGYVVDSSGAAIPDGNGNVQLLPGYDIKNGRVVKTPTGRPKTLSASDRHRLATLAEDLRYGVAPKQHYDSTTAKWIHDPNDKGTPNSSYSEAYARLIDEGATPKLARKLVNQLYKPGQFGRPPSAAQRAQKAALAKGAKDAAAAVAAGTYGPQLPSGGH